MMSASRLAVTQTSSPRVPVDERLGEPFLSFFGYACHLEGVPSMVTFALRIGPLPGHALTSSITVCTRDGARVTISARSSQH